MSLTIRKGDKVIVLSGKNKGKTGKVLEVNRSERKAIIEGINLVKKHLRRRSEAETGGIKEMPKPLTLSKVALLCPGCSKPARFNTKILADNTKTRICKRCHQAI